MLLQLDLVVPQPGKTEGRRAVSNGGHDRQPGMHTHIVTLGTLPHLVSHVCTHTTGAQ